MKRLIILLCVFTVVLANGVASAQPFPGGEEPPRGPDPRGVVLDALRQVPAESVCRGNYELAHRDRVGGVAKVLCTHGPDPGPEGVDVRQRRAPDPGTAESVPSSGTAAANSTGIRCFGTGADGYRVQLVYARASNVADRFATYSSSFARWAAAVEAMVSGSASETGGTRHVRFLTTSSCNLVIDRVTLSAAGDDNLSNTISELRAKGYTRTDRKYLVWVDANVYCGIAQVYYDDSPNPTPGFNASNGNAQVPGEVARIDNGCWGQANSVEAHELVHNLGGVQTSAPNATSKNHCRDEYDRMCYSDGSGAALVYRCASTHENRLDCNHDDYFHTRPASGTYLATHWNTASSAFLSFA
jgi:hypothetical protein